MPASAISKLIHNKLLDGLGCFLLCNLGYTFNNRKLHQKSLKRYLVAIVLLVCYTIVALRSVASNDFGNFLITFIWTAQIFCTAVIKHKELMAKRKNNAQNSISLNEPCNYSTPWGHRLIYYSIAMSVLFIAVIYCTISGLRVRLGMFSSIAYLLGLFDGFVECLVDFYEATAE